MKRIIAVLLLISISIFPLNALGESNQALCYNIVIDSTNKRLPVIHLLTSNADIGHSITASLLLNDGQTKVTGLERNINITGNETVYTFEMPENTLPGEYYFKFSSVDVTISTQSLNKYVIPLPSGSVPNFTMSQVSSEAGIDQEVTINAVLGVSSFTGASLQFINSALKQTDGVSVVNGSFNNGNCEMKLTIPSSVPSGEYKVRLQVLGKTKDMSYLISLQLVSSSDPQITDIDTSGAVLRAGSINGNIIVKGNNFSAVSSQNMIEIVDSQGSKVGTTIIPDAGSNNYLTFQLPTDIIVGTYKIRVRVGGKSALSTESFLVEQTNYLVTPTPGVGSSPAIENVSLSEGSVNVEGAISGNIIVLCSGFLTKPEDNKVHFIDSNGIEKGSMILDTTSTSQRLVSAIDTSLLAGEYKAKIIVASKAYIANSSFQILKEAQAMPSNVPFSITALDVSGAMLTEGAIGGNIIIRGSGFTSNPSLVELVKYNEFMGTYTASLVSFTANNIVIRVPSNTAKGIYQIKVTIAGKIAFSRTFEVIGGIDGLPYGNQSQNPGIIDKASPTPPAMEIKVLDNKTTYDEKNNKLITEINGFQLLSKLSSVDRSKKIEVGFQLPEVVSGTGEVVIGPEALSIIVANSLDIKLESKELSLKVPNDFIKKYASAQMRFEVSPYKISNNDVANMISKTVMAGKVIQTDIIDLKVYSENGPAKKIITNFNTMLKLEFNIDGIESSTDKRKLGIYFYDEQKKTWVYMGGRYNKETRSFDGYTNHFTKFAVMKYDILFKDVGKKHWAMDYIEVLASKYVVNGVGNNLFVPEGKVKRSEFSTILVKALGIPLEQYQGMFGDVGKNDWFSLYVEALARNGIVSGTGKGRFSPNAQITNQEMAVMIMNSYKYVNGKSYKELIKATSKVPYKDMGKVSVWALEQVVAAYTAGIIDTARGDLFNPKSTATRAETCKIVYNLTLKE